MGTSRELSFKCISINLTKPFLSKDFKMTHKGTSIPNVLITAVFYYRRGMEAKKVESLSEWYSQVSFSISSQASSCFMHFQLQYFRYGAAAVTP